MPHIPHKPKSDREFFEILSNIIFVAGFRYSVVQARWPKITKAFQNFDIKKVAKLNVEDLVKAEGMIKNKPKLAAIIENAKICLEIIKEHKSVMKYMENIQKLHKKDPLFNPTLQEEVQRFNRIGKTTSVWVAYVITREKALLN
tara:strand:- start:416 stop:847 length:432 start_codon:yes stop_codon:yes gene_type:complete